MSRKINKPIRMWASNFSLGLLQAGDIKGIALHKHAKKGSFDKTRVVITMPRKKTYKKRRK